MAYRRKQVVSRGETLKEEIPSPSPRVYQHPAPPLSDENPSSSLAAKAIRASSAYRDSSLSSAYGPSSQASNPLRSPSSSSTKDSPRHKYTSMKSLDETKPGFWGVLARKAKGIIEDDNVGQHRESPGRSGQQFPDTSTRARYYDPYQSPESSKKSDNPKLQKGLGAIASSINYIGGTIGNALEEGIAIVENKTADIIQETKKLQLRKKGGISEARSQASSIYNTQQQPQMTEPQMETDLDIQLKASRDVRLQLCIIVFR